MFWNKRYQSNNNAHNPFFILYKISLKKNEFFRILFVLEKDKSGNSNLTLCK